MKKNLLTIGLLALSFSAQSQITSTPKVLCHVDAGATFYVGKGALVYNGGGLQVKDTGIWENRGNVMIVANDAANDVFRTLNGTADKAEGSSTGGTFINRLNEPTAYASVNTPDNATTTTVDESSVYTYGQLYISGLTQNNIAGIVNQEYRQVKHGAYQQLAMPFFDKTFSTLSAEFNKTFNNTRYSQNEILVWNNANVEFDNVNTGSKSAAPGTKYFALGSLGLDTSSQVFTLHGRPMAEESAPSITLTNAGNSVNFGPGGNNLNSYGGKYNTYLQDGFHTSSGGTVWQGTFGKNIYQFGNPFLTNVDLSRIAYNEAATVGDGINLSNIRGVRLEVSGVQYSPNVGGGSTSFKYINFDASGVPTNDVDYMVVRPMGTFVIKLKDNTAANQTLNFANLRRFNYLPRAANVNYNVTAAKSVAPGTVKQLGVIGLDINGNEIARTYYVVSPNASTGHSSTSFIQVTAPSTNLLGTYEEDPVNGMYDNAYTNSYWLYSNEANEVNFLGKPVPMALYSTNINSLKFEIRENAELVADGTHALSTGIGFYYKASNGTVQQATQGGVVPVTTDEYGLFYGQPTSSVLATTENLKPTRTMVVYNPEVTDYIVIFDPNWKTADIKVFDMSGKLVLSEKNINAKSNYTIKLSNSIKNTYIVHLVSDKGERVTTKILK